MLPVDLSRPNSRTAPVPKPQRALPKKPRRQKSAGWTTSLIGHGIALAIVAAMMAPADIGLGVQNVLTLRFAKEPVEQPALTYVTVPQPPAADVAPAVPEPVDVFATSTLDLAPATPGQTADDAEGAAGQHGGATGAAGSDNSVARGTFFGISATGHSFVYILDRSGSMRGGRYRRAADELIRSVDALHATQRFYVFLFNNVATPMFDDPSPLPIPILATVENKRRLVAWLDQAGPDGGTNPTEALRLSLKMGGSAIFLLSDGEFDTSRNDRGKILVPSTQDAFGVVSASGANQPIHTIALESPSGATSLQRLSAMTSGEYRFVDKEEVDSAGLLAAVDRARRDGQIDEANQLLREVITTARPEIVGEVKQKYQAVLTADAQSVLQNGNAVQLAQSLAGLLIVDAGGELFLETQATLAQRMIDVMPECLDTQPLREVVPAVNELLVNHGGHPLVQSLRRSLWPTLLQRLDQMPLPADAEDQWSMAISLWRPDLTPTELVALTSTVDRLTCCVVNEALGRQNEASISQFGRRLLDWLTELEPFPTVRARVDDQRRDFIFYEIAAARDARSRRDRDGVRAIEARLRLWVDSSESIGDYKVEFGRREVSARAEFRRLAKRHGRSTHPPARKDYGRLIADFPHTIAAGQASELLGIQTITPPTVAAAAETDPAMPAFADLFNTSR